MITMKTLFLLFMGFALTLTQRTTLKNIDPDDIPLILKHYESSDDEDISKLIKSLSKGNEKSDISYNYNPLIYQNQKGSGGDRYSFNSPATSYSLKQYGSSGNEDISKLLRGSKDLDSSVYKSYRYNPLLYQYQGSGGDRYNINSPTTSYSDRYKYSTLSGKNNDFSSGSNGNIKYYNTIRDNLNNNHNYLSGGKNSWYENDKYNFIPKRSKYLKWNDYNENLGRSGYSDSSEYAVDLDNSKYSYNNYGKDNLGRINYRRNNGRGVNYGSDLSEFGGAEFGRDNFDNEISGSNYLSLFKAENEALNRNRKRNINWDNYYKQKDNGRRYYDSDQSESGSFGTGYNNYQNLGLKDYENSYNFGNRDRGRRNWNKLDKGSLGLDDYDSGDISSYRRRGGNINLQRRNNNYLGNGRSKFYDSDISESGSFGSGHNNYQNLGNDYGKRTSSNTISSLKNVGYDNIDLDNYNIKARKRLDGYNDLHSLGNGQEGYIDYINSRRGDVNGDWSGHNDYENGGIGFDDYNLGDINNYRSRGGNINLKKGLSTNLKEFENNDDLHQFENQSPNRGKNNWWIKEAGNKGKFDDLIINKKKEFGGWVGGNRNKGKLWDDNFDQLPISKKRGNINDLSSGIQDLDYIGSINKNSGLGKNNRPIDWDRSNKFNSLGLGGKKILNEIENQFVFNGGRGWDVNENSYNNEYGKSNDLLDGIQFFTKPDSSNKWRINNGRRENDDWKVPNKFKSRRYNNDQNSLLNGKFGVGNDDNIQKLGVDLIDKGESIIGSAIKNKKYVDKLKRGGEVYGGTIGEDFIDSKGQGLDGFHNIDESDQYPTLLKVNGRRRGKTGQWIPAYDDIPSVESEGQYNTNNLFAKRGGRLGSRGDNNIDNLLRLRLSGGGEINSGGEQDFNYEGNNNINQILRLKLLENGEEEYSTGSGNIDQLLRFGLLANGRGEVNSEGISSLRQILRRRLIGNGWNGSNPERNSKLIQLLLRLLGGGANYSEEIRQQLLRCTSLGYGIEQSIEYIISWLLRINLSGSVGLDTNFEESDSGNQLLRLNLLGNGGGQWDSQGTGNIGDLLRLRLGGGELNSEGNDNINQLLRLKLLENGEEEYSNGSGNIDQLLRLGLLANGRGEVNSEGISCLRQILRRRLIGNGWNGSNLEGNGRLIQLLLRLLGGGANYYDEIRQQLLRCKSLGYREEESIEYIITWLLQVRISGSVDINFDETDSGNQLLRLNLLGNGGEDLDSQGTGNIGDLLRLRLGGGELNSEGTDNINQLLRLKLGNGGEDEYSNGSGNIDQLLRLGLLANGRGEVNSEGISCLRQILRRRLIGNGWNGSNLDGNGRLIQLLLRLLGGGANYYDEIRQQLLRCKSLGYREEESIEYIITWLLQVRISGSVDINFDENNSGNQLLRLNLLGNGGEDLDSQGTGNIGDLLRLRLGGGGLNSEGTDNINQLLRLKLGNIGEDEYTEGSGNLDQIIRLGLLANGRGEVNSEGIDCLRQILRRRLIGNGWDGSNSEGTSKLIQLLLRFLGGGANYSEEIRQQLLRCSSMGYGIEQSIEYIISWLLRINLSGSVDLNANSEGNGFLSNLLQLKLLGNAGGLLGSQGVGGLLGGSETNSEGSGNINQLLRLKLLGNIWGSESEEGGNLEQLIRLGLLANCRGEVNSEGMGYLRKLLHLILGRRGSNTDGFEYLSQILLRLVGGGAKYSEEIRQQLLRCRLLGYEEEQSIEYIITWLLRLNLTASAEFEFHSEENDYYDQLLRLKLLGFGGGEGGNSDELLRLRLLHGLTGRNNPLGEVLRLQLPGNQNVLPGLDLSVLGNGNEETQTQEEVGGGGLQFLGLNLLGGGG